MNVFVTGGTKGIGKEIKNLFETNKHIVYAPTRQEMDLSDLNSVNNFLDNFHDDVDILVNNAGINQVEELLDFKLETYNNVMNTNFLSHLLITTNFINRSKLKNNKLNIINIGSIRSKKIKKGRFLYSLSKNSLDILTKYIVYECSNQNIICNTISPGYVNTDLLYKNNSIDKVNTMRDEVPLKYFVEPEEVAKLAYHLSINNSYINGQNINIDGGITCS